jgi:hypothetical protein
MGQVVNAGANPGQRRVAWHEAEVVSSKTCFTTHSCN